jgi:hypothetical protein
MRTPYPKLDKVLDKTGKKQRSGFQPGQSGNPLGRPKGSLNKTTIFTQDLLREDVEVMMKKLKELALGGNLMAIKLWLERVVPIAKDSPIKFSLPTIQSPDDLVMACERITRALSTGKITLEQAETLMKIFVDVRDNVLLLEVMKELDELKAQMEKGGRL